LSEFLVRGIDFPVGRARMASKSMAGLAMNAGTFAPPQVTAIAAIANCPENSTQAEILNVSS